MSSATVSCPIAYGSGWLGQVPKSWSTLPGRRLFAQRREQATSDDEQLSASQRYGVVPQSLFMQKEDQKVMLALNGTSNFRHVEPNDFVISLRSFEGGIEHSAYRGCVSPAYTVLRARNLIEPSFYRYLFKSAPYIAALQSTTDSLRDGKSITYDQFGAIHLPVPPLLEQAALAIFLDRETGKIDALVEEQKRLIELLKEKRQAVISHAVTKGLNPNVRMKPSGVEWLGDVPEHWEVVALKRNLEFLTSGSRGWAEHYSDDGALFLRIGNLTRDSLHLDLSDVQKVSVPYGSESERTRVRGGDILFSITAFLGSVAVVPDDLEPAYVSQHLALARLRDCTVLPHWVGYAALSSTGKGHFLASGYGGTKIQLSLDDIASLPIPKPPAAEQRAILAHLDGELTRITSLQTAAEEVIALLQERRSALISAAVTGKVDGRNLNAQEEAA